MPLNSTLYKLAVEVVVIVIFASVLTACLIVSKYTLAALISFIEEVELATSAWLAVNVPGVLVPLIATRFAVSPSSLPM